MEHNQSLTDAALPTSLHKFADQVGRSAPTIWRWQKLGWIEKGDVLNIAGKPYITAEGIAKFNRRAAAGEFAKKPHAPVPPNKGKGGE
jgi:hypothetical protein